MGWRRVGGPTGSIERSRNVKLSELTPVAKIPPFEQHETPINPMTARNGGRHYLYIVDEDGGVERMWLSVNPDNHLGAVCDDAC